MKKKQRKQLLENDKVNVQVSVTWESEFKPRSKKEKQADRKKRSKGRGKAPKNQKQSGSIRKAPRASRSASARRWRDLRTDDGIRSEVKHYRYNEEGELVEVDKRL